MLKSDGDGDGMKMKGHVVLCTTIQRKGSSCSQVHVKTYPSQYLNPPKRKLNLTSKSMCIFFFNFKLYKFENSKFHPKMQSQCVRTSTKREAALIDDGPFSPNGSHSTTLSNVGKSNGCKSLHFHVAYVIQHLCDGSFERDKYDF